MTMLSRRSGSIATILCGGLSCASALPLEISDPEVVALAPACVDHGLAACETGCDEGDGAACLAASVAHAKGIRTEKNPEKMAALEERACERDVGAGCFYAGNNLEPSDPRTLPWYDRGCELGHARSCAFAGLARLFSKTPLDAVVFLERACGHANPTACNWMADAAHLGVFGEPTPAAAYYERACTAGAGAACRTLKAKDQVWFTLPVELVFKTHEMPDPKLDRWLHPGAESTVGVNVCIQDGQAPKVDLTASSGDPWLDSTVVWATRKWRFSFGPLIRKDAVLCGSWRFDIQASMTRVGPG